MTWQRNQIYRPYLPLPSPSDSSVYIQGPSSHTSFHRQAIVERTRVTHAATGAVYQAVVTIQPVNKRTSPRQNKTRLNFLDITHLLPTMQEIPIDPALLEEETTLDNDLNDAEGEIVDDEADYGGTIHVSPVLEIKTINLFRQT